MNTIHQDPTIYRPEDDQPERTVLCDFCFDYKPESSVWRLGDGLERCIDCREKNAHICAGPCESGTVIFGNEELCDACHLEEMKQVIIEDTRVNVYERMAAQDAQNAHDFFSNIMSHFTPRKQS